ncbi:hypothetical protein AB1K54_15995 [Microbacterium sp. BWT-B31]|uniref:hypothetical protein n=1 Tax=Microbacterium sp. BWT-B31 TaxID=3232072 RepID=UPI003527EA9A
MTTPDSTRTADVDALVLTRRASAGQHLLAAGVDVVVPVALAAVAFVAGAAEIGWMLLLVAIALAAASVTSLARTGRSGISTGSRGFWRTRTSRASR